jgi:hypothetical protein
MNIKCLWMTVLAIGAVWTSGWGADISGEWKNRVVINGNTQEETYVFTPKKNNANRFTGKFAGFYGVKGKITDGRIDGEKVSFLTEITTRLTTGLYYYEGVIKGDEIEMYRSLEPYDASDPARAGPFPQPRFGADVKYPGGYSGSTSSNLPSVRNSGSTHPPRFLYVLKKVIR